MSSFHGVGHPTRLFVTPLADDFICGLCLDVLNNPYQCRNGHCFCYSCIQSALSATKACPVCKCSMTVDSMTSNLLIRNLIDKSEVSCEIEGECPWTGPLHRREVHQLNECDFRMLICSNVGCSTKLQRRFHAVHVNEECPHRLQVCHHCTKSFKAESFGVHQDNCNLKPVVCRCKETVLNADMASHLENDCPLQPCQCPLSYMGCCTSSCPRQFVRSEVSAHIAQVTQEPHFVGQLTETLLRTVKRNEELTLNQARLDAKLNSLATLVCSLQDALATKADRLTVNTKLSLAHGNYVGEATKEGKRQGYGRMTYHDPSVYGYYYEGQWEDDAINGQGSYKCRDGRIVTGVWQTGLLNGVRYYDL